MEIVARAKKERVGRGAEEEEEVFKLQFAVVICLDENCNWAARSSLPRRSFSPGIRASARDKP